MGSRDAQTAEIIGWRPVAVGGLEILWHHPSCPFTTGCTCELGPDVDDMLGWLGRQGCEVTIRKTSGAPIIVSLDGTDYIVQRQADGELGFGSAREALQAAVLNVQRRQPRASA